MSANAVIVTGGNRGIGKAIVEGLWKKTGYHIVLACRDKASGEQAAESIRKMEGGGQIEVMRLDLSSFASVHQFVEEFKAKDIPLYALVNNAGILRWKGWIPTKDGFEEHLQANHLGHFLLVLELLDLLLRRPGSRVVAVGSHLADYAKLDWTNINAAEGFNAYKQSKLANLLHVQELHRRFSPPPSRLRAMCVDPGEVNTDITRYFPLAPLINAILAYIPERHTPEQGADSVVHCVVCGEEEADRLSGCFVREREAVDLSTGTGTAFSRLALWLVMKRPNDPDSQGPAAAKRMWTLSEDLVLGRVKLPMKEVGGGAAGGGLIERHNMWLLVPTAVAVTAVTAVWFGAF